MPRQAVANRVGASGRVSTSGRVPDLIAGLVSHWKLDEASGSRADAYGTNTLTDNNTVTQGAGKIANAAQFTASNSEYLSCADNPSLRIFGTDFSFAFWVYLDTKSADQRFVSRIHASLGTARDYRIAYDVASDRFVFLIFTTTGSPQASASTFGSPSLATWHFIVANYTLATKTLGISVNAGTENTTVHTGLTQNSNTSFNIGRDAFGGYANGRIDEVSFRKRTLAAPERITLYNAGNGIAYPFGSGRGALA